MLAPLTNFFNIFFGEEDDWKFYNYNECSNQSWLLIPNILDIQWSCMHKIISYFGYFFISRILSNQNISYCINNILCMHIKHT
jgi:hypothetical protein